MPRRRRRLAPLLGLGVPRRGSTRRARDDRDCAEELRELLIDAVRLQLRADVPVGAYLSGGLDSSIIATLIRRYTDDAAAHASR